MRLITALAILCVFSACAGWSDYKRGWAAGKVPCAVGDIEASNEPAQQLGASMPFEVQCHGETYACARECTSFSGWVCQNAQTSCAPALRQQSVAKRSDDYIPPTSPKPVKKVSDERKTPKREVVVPE